MQRRHFLAAAGLAGAASLSAPLSSMAAPDDRPYQNRQYYELRKYHLLNTSRQDALNSFLEETAIPAMNRLGIETVGAFRVKYGQTQPTLYVLLPHPSLESVVTLSARLADDEAFVEDGASFLEASISEPAFVRMESELKQAFTGMSQLEVPAQTAENGSRIFELRTYESHSPVAARKKIEMFNEGGEIDIFRKTGLTPVFFSETLIGENLPNLTYMLVFENLQQRDDHWAQFVSDPDWKALSQDDYYADTVSNISDIILEPLPYSQI